MRATGKVSSQIEFLLKLGATEIRLLNAGNITQNSYFFNMTVVGQNGRARKAKLKKNARKNERKIKAFLLEFPNILRIQ